MKYGRIWQYEINRDVWIRFILGDKHEITGLEVANKTDKPIEVTQEFLTECWNEKQKEVTR